MSILRTKSKGVIKRMSEEKDLEKRVEKLEQTTKELVKLIVYIGETADIRFMSEYEKKEFFEKLNKFK